MRTALINHVCEACAESVGPLEPLLLEVGNRVQDKKAAVRSAARSNLCGLYRKHLTNTALHWIPQRLLSSYGNDNSSSSSEVSPNPNPNPNPDPDPNPNPYP